MENFFKHLDRICIVCTILSGISGVIMRYSNIDLALPFMIAAGIFLLIYLLSYFPAKDKYFMVSKTPWYVYHNTYDKNGLDFRAEE